MTARAPDTRYRYAHGVPLAAIRRIAPAVDYPVDKAELVGRLQGEGAKRELGGQRGVAFTFGTLPLCIRLALTTEAIPENVVTAHEAVDMTGLPDPAGWEAAGPGPADNVLSRMVDILGVRTEAQLARGLGVSAKVLAGWRRQGWVPFALVVEFARRSGATLDWLVLGSRRTSERRRDQDIASHERSDRFRSLFRVDPSLMSLVAEATGRSSETIQRFADDGDDLTADVLSNIADNTQLPLDLLVNGGVDIDVDVLRPVLQNIFDDELLCNYPRSA